MIRLTSKPPAPIAHVTLRNPASGARVDAVPLLLDTGADVTLLPRPLIEQIAVAVEADQTYELMGFDGSRSFVPVVGLEMVFLRRLFRGRYLLTEDSRGIMGRDILNHLALLFDGPEQHWSEYSL